MSGKYLHREDAPFSEEVWGKIDNIVVAAAKSQLSGRRLLHIDGPYGLGLKALPTGDSEIDEKTSGSAKMSSPCLTPLVMIYSEFSIPYRDIAAFEQTGLPLDTSGAARAAIDCARQEDNVIFNGSKKMGIKGLMNIDGTSSMKIKSWEDVGVAANDVIQAVTTLDRIGFHGPFALGLAPDLYNSLFRLYPQGNQTEMQHIQQIVTDGIVKISALSAGGILIATGGDFASIVLGQDLTTGFIGPDDDAEYEFNVSLSLALRVNQPQAICILQK